MRKAAFAGRNRRGPMHPCDGAGGNGLITGMMTGTAMQEFTVGRLTLLVAEGDLRRIRFDGVEVLRRVSYPVRDEGWGTCPVTTVSEAVETDVGRLRYTHRFAARDGRFGGTFRADVTDGPDGAILALSVEIDSERDMAVNRAGFTLLHPLEGVVAAPLAVTHSGGAVESTVWPALVSPAQPAFDIAGLTHEVAGVRVAIAMTGEVFEMEDQRNWTDASYKTYCRPLAWPLPYRLGPGAPVRQGVEVRLSGRGEAAKTESAKRGVMPEVAVAMEAGLATRVLPEFPVQLRLRAGDAVPDLAGPVQVEIVVNERLDGLEAAVAACRKLEVVRMTALTEPYLKSHQPEGPWPDGPTPADMVQRVRALLHEKAMGGVAVGGGMFTNFTEFNRCPPKAALVDFVTWGGTAIVHAADDLSVIETLEALQHVIATGRGLAGGKPLHLGLFSIGMRSNPYAAECVANPAGERIAMVRDDPRQRTRFAACHAVGVLAAAATGGVASLALAMTDGPLGVVSDGTVTPLYHVLRFAQRLRGAAVTVVAGDVLRIDAATGAVVAVLAGETVLAQGARGWIMNDRSEIPAQKADWLDSAPADLGGVRLGPFDLAFLTGDGA